MILVLAGTSDGRELALNLDGMGYEVLVTATTEYGGVLVSESGLNTLVKKLTKMDMVALINEKNIRIVVDATHPYAANASANAIEACVETEAHYIRFEREDLDIQGVTHFVDHESAVAYLCKTEGNIFLTIGSNFIGLYAAGVEKERLFARVLPTASVVEKCMKAGLQPKQIIAIQGPFTEALNVALFNNYDAKYIVSKESSSVGGTMEKVEAAQKVGAELILIDRPHIAYPLVTQKIEDVPALIERLLRS